MNRREFLALSGITAAWYWTERFLPRTVKTQGAVDRLSKWAPNSSDFVQWRYAAGQIVDGGQDFGFIISTSDIKIPGFQAQQLLVERKDFLGTQEFVNNVYDGTRTYDAASATYIFQDEANQEIARWQWDETNQIYNLSVTTPELTLDNVALRPQGDLIPEGVDGEIQAGRVKGILIDSDYHADWTEIEINNVKKGIARIDMQGLRPSFEPATNEAKYVHYWFAIAVELSGGVPVWISAWRIEDAQGPYWGLTIARGSSTSWEIALALSDENSPNPIEVETLAQQSLPAAPGKYSGQKWRLRAANNVLDLEITVPPGQFISDTPLEGFGGPSQMQEAVGKEVTGTVLGAPVASTKLVVAESTAEFFLNFLPAILK